jgi:hypothetical protein
MIKISKENLYVWSRLIPVIFLIIHAWILFVCIMMNFWPLYLVYVAIASLQFLVIGAWRYFYLRDVYVSENLKKVIFKDLKNNETVHDLNQITTYKTSFGITKVSIDEKGAIIKYYFMINSYEDVKYLIL